MVTYRLTIGLVIGDAVGIILGSLMDNLPMGIVFGAGGRMLVGLAFGTYLDNRHKG